MQNKLFSFALALVFSTITLNAMDLEKDISQEEKLTTVPLDLESPIKQFKSLFKNTSSEELVPHLYQLKDQPQALRTIKNWLKDQKINLDEYMFYRTKKFATHKAAIATFWSFIFSMYLSLAFHGDKLGLYVAPSIALLYPVIAYCFTLSRKSTMNRNLQKNNKIRSLLSAIRNMKTE